MAKTKDFWKAIRLISLQFSFSNQNVIPASIKKRLSHETLKQGRDRAQQKARPSGVVLIEPIENIGIADFIGDVEKLGYELVDALYQPRLDTPEKGYWTYNMVRFLFARHEHAKPSTEFRSEREAVLADLSKMVTDAAWRVRAFVNPFFQDGAEVPDEHVLSMNLEARKPLVQPDGKPVVVWQKDEAGNRIGDAPLPVKPDLQLRAMDSKIQFVEG